MHIMIMYYYYHYWFIIHNLNHYLTRQKNFKTLFDPTMIMFCNWFFLGVWQYEIRCTLSLNFSKVLKKPWSTYESLKILEIIEFCEDFTDFKKLSLNNNMIFNQTFKIIKNEWNSHHYGKVLQISNIHKNLQTQKNLLNSVKFSLIIGKIFNSS